MSMVTPTFRNLLDWPPSVNWLYYPWDFWSHVPACRETLISSMWLHGLDDATYLLEYIYGGSHLLQYVGLSWIQLILVGYMDYVVIQLVQKATSKNLGQVCPVPASSGIQRWISFDDRHSMLAWPLPVGRIQRRRGNSLEKSSTVCRIINLYN